MFTVFLSWRYWLRLFLAFFIPFLVFSAAMQQASIGIKQSIGNLNIQPNVALVSADSIAPLLVQNIEKNSAISYSKNKEEAQILLDKDSVAIILIGHHSQEIEAIYNSSKNGDAVNNILNIIENFEQDYFVEQMDSLGINRQAMQPFVLTKTNLFSPMQLIEDIANQVKNSLANIINLLFVFFILWLVRNLVLTHRIKATASIGMILFSTLLGGLIAMAVVFYGFHKGINIQEKGLIQSLIININQFLEWKNLQSFFLLWIPTWFLIISLLGWVVYSTNDLVKAHVRSFWVVIVLHILAFAALIPIQEMSLLQMITPLYNVFGVGQMSLQETLIASNWWIAFATNIGLGILVLGLWFKTKKPLELEG